MKYLIFLVVLFVPNFPCAADPVIRVLTAEVSRPQIETVALEDYLKGILVGEMPPAWPVEALKAQAVAARSYAYSILLGKKNSSGPGSYDVKATTEDQVYKNHLPPRPKLKAAVAETKGEVLTFHDQPIQARFHSSCGGETEISLHVWGKGDQSKRISDPFCSHSPYNQWNITLTPQEITKRLSKHGFDPGPIQSINPEKFDVSGRVAAIAIHGRRQTLSLTGNDFRRFIGFNTIKSTLFNVIHNSHGFTFAGRGFGHGVGMCQWGAKGMAEAGSSYKDILEFYYPGTEIKKIY